MAGASPEMLVRVEGRRVETRPIAGTRPRGASAEEDQSLERELLADEKERAEHLMLVDLGRNDLGRVCRVPERDRAGADEGRALQPRAHLVSSVTGELARGRTLSTPWPRPSRRARSPAPPRFGPWRSSTSWSRRGAGLYGGALGYLDLSGNLDFCIAIRTLLLGEGRATLQAGAGIVADSDPSAEARETEAKAGAMLEALSLAGRL